MTDVFTVVGARPQFIKAAVVSSALRDAGLSEALVHTGQHYDREMSDVFFEQLGLSPPAHHLGIGGLSHGKMTGRMLESLEALMVDVDPRCVLVYGDTNSTMAAALAAVKLGIPVAHVEAGMRSFNRSMPEEINRLVTDHVGRWHFVTSEEPRRLLAREGIEKGVHVVGDVMFDAVHLYSDAISAAAVVERGPVADRPFVLCTVHRQENTDSVERLRGIFAALERLSREIDIVLPMHPRTKNRLAEHRISLNAGALHVIEPIGYFEMQGYLRAATVAATDSGGLQKEAYFHGVPCVTLRDETEWTETVDLGWNCLVGADEQRIVDAVEAARVRPRDADRPSVYGDGRAATRICEILRMDLQQGDSQ